MRPVFLLPALLFHLAPTSCSTASEEAEDLLQSSCVHEELTLDRTLEDGSACDNFGYSDCARGSSGSECINYCAFKFCQSGPCESDDDCSAFGAIYACQEYIVSDRSYGMWCGESDCVKGLQGCPCLDTGDCYNYPFIEAYCGEDNICTGTYTCQEDCIQGSVCCGGSLCSGNCIGTPCC